MKQVLRLIPLAAVLLMLGTDALGAGDLVAKVNGAGITREEFDRNWKVYIKQRGIPSGHADKSGGVDEFRKELLDLMVDQELLYQDAQKKGYGADEKQVDEELARSGQGFPSPEEFDKALAQNGLTRESYSDFLKRRLTVDKMLREGIAKNLAVTDAEIDEYYSGNPDQFASPEQARARHILIKVDAGADETQKAAARQKIEEVLSKAKGDADFAELAKEYSEGPSAPRGGDLGLFTRGRMVPPFEEAAFALKPGEISGVVETRFGYHIIKVEERKDAGTISKEEAADKIREFLNQRKVAEAVTDRIKVLKEEAKIETFL